MNLETVILLIVLPAYGSAPVPPVVVGEFQTVAVCEAAGARVVDAMVRTRKAVGLSSKVVAEVVCLEKKAEKTE